MDQQREQASQIAHEFIVYQESEQADIDAKDHQFDALWQSIYDVCKLIKFGIIDIGMYVISKQYGLSSNTHFLII